MSTHDYFIYGDEDFRIAGDRSTRSNFDVTLISKWGKAMQKGLFNYDLGHIKSKHIEGPHKYVALLNEKRATERRPPQAMFSVNQPFDSNKFNFTKVKEEEILFQLKHKNRTTLTKDQIIINVSPVDCAHSLIVPEVDKQHNQNLTLHGIQLSLELMCLSFRSSFKIGFNSLCSHASVNHQHLHCYYTDEVLLADWVPGVYLTDKMYKLNIDAPHGFGFEMKHIDELSSKSRLIFKCVDHMRCNEIAHALFMCKGRSFSNPDETAIRVLLWPRTKILGPKPSEAAFNTAVLEMAGHLLIKDEEYYDNMSDELALSCFKDMMLPEREWLDLTESFKMIGSQFNDS